MATNNPTGSQPVFVGYSQPASVGQSSVSLTYAPYQPSTSGWGWVETTEHPLIAPPPQAEWGVPVVFEQDYSDDWQEFLNWRGRQVLARALGVDPNAPDTDAPPAVVEPPAGRGIRLRD